MRFGAIALCVALVLGGAACGDDDDDASGGGGERLSEAAFVDAGNDICKAGNEKLDAAGNDTFGETEGEPDPEALRGFINDEVVPTIEGMIADMKALQGPDDLEAQRDDLVDEAEAALQEFRDAAESDNPGEMFQGQDPFEKANQIADEMGWTECRGDDEAPAG